MQIQRDEDVEEEKVPSLYLQNGLKIRYGYRETKRKRRCLLCICRMVSRDDASTERRKGRWDVYFVSVGWSEKAMRIQRDEDEDEEKEKVST